MQIKKEKREKNEYIYNRGVKSAMNIYVQELQKVSNELQLHNSILNLICNVKDDAEVEDIQIVLDYFADRLMNLDDEVQSILEF
ncbi:hypothetical protein HMPREF3037_00329 [Candidatus Stoquefichus sp. KLE1796]|nr:hypothetical protein HMPREF3037_00329 [Candidatus Stoquefichus sp. KLE1796]